LIEVFLAEIVVGISIKCLWAEYLSDQGIDRFYEHVSDMGVNAVCVRSESLSQAMIEKLQHKEIKVYGWCYPHTRPSDDHDRSYGPTEAAWVKKLIGFGLDGYVFDIEDGKKGRPNDWTKTGDPNREEVGKQMVATIVTAFQRRGGSYLLGLTSHQWAFDNYVGIPWQAFLDECNVLFPQTYWRKNDGNDQAKACVKCSWDYSQRPIKLMGTVDQAIKNGFIDYANKKDQNGNALPIIPLIGEIGCTKKGEISRAWQLIQAKGVDQLHLYVDVDNMGWVDDDDTSDPSIIAEIKAIV
jgi:hypothetical protein